MSLHIVILAAGAGKRMYSSTSKLLHCLAGKPLLEHVIHTAQSLNPDKIHVIYGHQGEEVKQRFERYDLHWVFQDQQLGTGHAVQQVLPFISTNNRVLILYGDVPLIEKSTLSHLISSTTNNSLTLLTAIFQNPTGYGRIVREGSNRKVISIVEERDATAAQKKIDEIYSGIMCVSSELLLRWLPKLSTDNDQHEYYLTQVVDLAVRDNCSIETVITETPEEIFGVNDRLQLANLERYYQRQQVKKFLLQGVSFADPERFDLRGDLEVGRDIFIDVGVVCEGKVILEDNVSIGPYTVLKNVHIAQGTVIRSHCVMDDVVIGKNCVIGPYARLRPETILSDDVHIGNFVEVKKSKLGKNSKVNHLSYIGDATIGSQVNVGAGTITCNYDGVNKNQTIIGDKVFIGSDTQLIAPVNIGEGATIAAGSTVRKDIPAGGLTVTHQLQQRTFTGWQRTKKKKEL